MRATWQELSQQHESDSLLCPVFNMPLSPLPIEAIAMPSRVPIVSRLPPTSKRSVVTTTRTATTTIFSVADAFAAPTTAPTSSSPVVLAPHQWTTSLPPPTAPTFSTLPPHLRDSLRPTPPPPSQQQGPPDAASVSLGWFDPHSVGVASCSPSTSGLSAATSSLAARIERALSVPFRISSVSYASRFLPVQASLDDDCGAAATNNATNNNHGSDQAGFGPLFAAAAGGGDDFFIQDALLHHHDDDGADVRATKRARGGGAAAATKKRSNNTMSKAGKGKSSGKGGCGEQSLDLAGVVDAFGQANTVHIVDLSEIAVRDGCEVPASLQSPDSRAVAVLEIVSQHRSTDHAKANFVVIKMYAFGLKISVKLYTTRYFQLFGIADSDDMSADQMCSTLLRFVSRILNNHAAQTGNAAVCVGDLDGAPEILALTAFHDGVSQQGLRFDVDVLEQAYGAHVAAKASSSSSGQGGSGSGEFSASRNHRNQSLVIRLGAKSGSRMFHGTGTMQLMGLRCNPAITLAEVREVLQAYPACVVEAPSDAPGRRKRRRTKAGEAEAAAAVAAAGMKMSERDRSVDTCTAAPASSPSSSSRKVVPALTGAGAVAGAKAAAEAASHAAEAAMRLSGNKRGRRGEETLAVAMAKEEEDHKMDLFLDLDMMVMMSHGGDAAMERCESSSSASTVEGGGGEGSVLSDSELDAILGCMQASGAGLGLEEMLA